MNLKAYDNNLNIDYYDEIINVLKYDIKIYN